MRPKYEFRNIVRREARKNTPIEEIMEMGKKYQDVTPEYVNSIIKELNQTSAVKQVVNQDNQKAKKVYEMIDSMFIQHYPHLIAYRRGTNTTFYMYQSGYYKFIDDQDMFNLMSSFFTEHELLQYRTKHKINDALLNVGTLLSGIKGRYFRDDDVFNSKFYINVKNGLLDPETLTLLPHTPDYFSISQNPFDYDPEATCPEFEKFIAKVSQKTPGTDVMIQEMYGYILATEGNPRHKVFYLYGSIARNGKSTAVEILIALMGVHNASRLSLEQIASNSPSIMESVVGKRLNFSDEVSGEFLQSGRLTSISAEGSIEISPKFKPAYIHKVKAKFVVACNSIPRLSENNGMKHRMIIIPFKYQIPESERILGYADMLIAKEGSGILNWALEGSRRLKENGLFSISEISAQELEDNNLMSNNVLAFLNDDYEFSSEFERKIPTTDLYGDKLGGYVEYCNRTGTKPMSYRKFATELKTFEEQTGKIVYNATGTRGYSGLEKRERDMDFEETIINKF